MYIYKREQLSPLIKNEIKMKRIVLTDIFGKKVRINIDHIIAYHECDNTSFNSRVAITGKETDFFKETTEEIDALIDEANK